MSVQDAPFLFRLRDDVSNDGVCLRDRLTGRVYDLNDTARQLVSLLDGRYTLPGVLSAAARLALPSRDPVERELRQLLLLGFFDGTCESFRQRLRALRAQPATPLLALPGARFACQHSGACCNGYVFGPITVAEKARIEALNPQRLMPQLEGEVLFEPFDGPPTETPTYQLGKRGDSCVFYEPGAGCGLHRNFGAGAKPSLCQWFPLAAVNTIDGLKVCDRGECATFATSATSGVPLLEQLPAAGGSEVRDLYHPAVLLRGKWRCDYGLVLMLADRLDVEATVKKPLAALQAIGHIARAFIGALLTCRLEAGQPESDCAAALALSAEAARPSASEVGANALRGLERLAVLAEALTERVSPTEPYSPVFVQAAETLAELCRHNHGGWDLSGFASRAVAVSMGEGAAEVMSLSLRHRLFGRELLLEEQLEAGLLRIAVALVLALTGARTLAAARGEAKASLAQLSRAHMVATRTLHRPAPHALLAANGAQVWPILDAMPSLAASVA